MRNRNLRKLKHKKWVGYMTISIAVGMISSLPMWLVVILLWGYLMLLWGLMCALGYEVAMLRSLNRRMAEQNGKLLATVKNMKDGYSQFYKDVIKIIKE